MTSIVAKTKVLDTNVAVVANGRSNARPDCIRNCVSALDTIRKSGKVAVDDGWRIIKEYRTNLNDSGQPGPGDLFLKWLLTNRTNPDRCLFVSITPTDGDDNYEEFPTTPSLEGFDPSDRKFVAVAAVIGKDAVILQAVDSKWWTFRHALQNVCIKVDFICENEVTRK